MPNEENTRKTRKWDTIRRQLLGDKVIPDPVRAEWDTGEYEGQCFTYRNFRLGRYEWAYGRIPAGRLSDYQPQEDKRWVS